MNRHSATITINKISDDAKVSLRKRVISAVVFSAIALPCVIIGDWFIFGLIVIALFISVLELIKCAKTKYSRWLYFFSFIFLLLLLIWPLLRNLIDSSSSWDGWRVYFAFPSPYISLIVLIASVFALLYLIMWDENFTVRDACFIFTTGLIISFGFQCMLFIRYIPLKEVNYQATNYYDFNNTIGSFGLFGYLLLGTFGTDIGAYFVGMFFGKSKVNPRISPKKTWAGFFGGLIISALLSGALAFILAGTGNPMLSIFDLSHWYNIVILSCILPCFATLGDFVFSAVKRYYGIKDFGHIMPGHGGVLDRVDSLLFSSIVVSLYIIVAIAICKGANPLI